MSILDTIKKDQMDARKAKDKQLSGYLTTLIGEVVIVGKNDGNRETTDVEAIKVVTKFKKGVDETIKIVKDAEKLKELEYELMVYNKYLPTQMSDDELEQVIVKIIDLESRTRTNNPLTKRDMGVIMSKLKAQYDGQYDGKIASKLVGQKL